MTFRLFVYMRSRNSNIGKTLVDLDKFPKSQFSKNGLPKYVKIITLHTEIGHVRTSNAQVPISVLKQFQHKHLQVALEHSRHLSNRLEHLHIQF